MSKKTVIKADLIGRACKSEILAIVATIKGIKSMDIDAEKCTLTVVGIVDPVRIVRKLRKKCFSACIVSVEDDKPKEEKDPCKEAKEKLEKAWKEYCEKCNVKLKPGCPCSCSSYPTPCEPCFPPSSPCSFPPISCHNRNICPPPCPPPCPKPCPPPCPPWGYGYGCYYEERYPGGECVIQ
uniref:HMA domain-containing protein n=1 Tax=Oryza meridionalis TaxID=40149 RepID=A0A0E0BZZ7_9ORYZ